ncbi:lytic transglycosylase domain-containing protein [Chelativorans sp. AA-79]|uniref:lytic transglycosylase domain-containing protein n=1 Tax=Chelativorans sp. AA-79 TaxID=3028735 RepID=UPI0023F76F1C|nr:lytic transglycosylase domain-containing protein [Chelativorans sp. AA-79]WEX11403.1 lytic transglycosylase domain-containing protein [Chelativorans sp. AA-79]
MGIHRARAVGALMIVLPVFNAFPGHAEPDAKADHLETICRLIEQHGTTNGLSPHFLARLLWKESRFDPNAVSPKGAEGVAQFMPATASLRGLDDAFDVEKAIPASAKYLSDLKRKFGNLGLAAAAYNAGEGRISRWLSRGGFLPLETENYVLDILGAPVDEFIEKGREVTIPPLEPGKPFGSACRNLPVSAAATLAMARVPIKPWGIQVAGHFQRSVAIRKWERIRKQVGDVVAGEKPVVSRVRSPRGRRGLYAVRLGADTREQADRICQKLKSAGAACIVLRNG